MSHNSARAYRHVDIEKGRSKNQGRDRGQVPSSDNPEAHLHGLSSEQGLQVLINEQYSLKQLSSAYVLELQRVKEEEKIMVARLQQLHGAVSSSHAIINYLYSYGKHRLNEA